MLTKPPECVTCVLAGSMVGFVPDRHVPGAVVTVLAQGPGKNEVEGKRITGFEYVGRKRIPIEVPNEGGPEPLIGATGYELDRTYLPLAGLTRGDVDLCNVIKCRWAPNGKPTNDLPPPKVLDQAVAHCTKAHLRVVTPKVIVMGALAAKHMGCGGSISEWRGYAWEAA